MSFLAESHLPDPVKMGENDQEDFISIPSKMLTVHVIIYFFPLVRMESPDQVIQQGGRIFILARGASGSLQII